MFVTIRKERNVLPQVLPRDLAADYQQEYASRIVAVKLDNTLHDLQTPVGKSRSIEFVELESEEGWIIYRRSVEFLLVMAVHELYPEAEVAAMFRANNGLYCEISVPGKKLTEAMAQAIEAEMRRIVEEDRPIVKEVLEREAAVKLFKETKQVEKANLIASLKLPKVSIYRCGDYYDYLYGAMIGSTGHLSKFALDIFESGVLLRTPDLKSKGEVPPSVPQPKLSEVLTEAKNWANILRCRYVTDLNRAIRSGRISEVIRVSEALQEKHIAEIADYIAKHRQKLRLILIAGPSSSGKTSFAQRLRVQLQVMGLRPFSISLDNYFVNREFTPRDEKGEYDYESIDALDIATFTDNIQRLLKGEEVEIPKFSFETGQRYYDGEKLKIARNNVIIVEGIHGLNPQLTRLLPPETLFKIFVSALTSIAIDNHNLINPTDNRLIRRMVRDYKYRNYSALDTLKRWESVLLGEQKHIVPYQEEADAIFNSALIYELGALKTQAEPLLREVTQQHPEHSKALRLLKFFSYIRAVPTREIPPTSIIREFLGGSSFKY